MCEIILFVCSNDVKFHVPWEPGPSHRVKNVSVKVVFVRKINVELNYSLVLAFMNH
jgi:hypothetical protein